MKILILGATGFIGSAILQRLASDGHTVTGLGRAPRKAQLKWPVARWIKADLARFTTADWHPLIEEHDIIVNSSGALQDGMSDNLVATQQEAMLSLYAAAKSLRGKLIIQISARTDGAAGSLAFLRTKRHADEALVSSGLPFVILRPALVIGRNAHGGTALLRSLASFPFVLPLVHSESPVATISIDDVAEAVSRAVTGSIPPNSDVDLAAEETPSLAELVRLHRAWLGLASTSVVTLPKALAKPVTWGADLAGKLGWRSPLRSTAMAVMSEGVLGSRRVPEGFVPASAAATLAGYPSGIQDLWFARLYLLKPVMILTLSLFWLLSGLVPLADPGAAAAHFSAFMPASAAMVVTLATCFLDILLGIAVVIRPAAQRALLGMLAVSAVYLIGGTLLEARLWLDPLGPFVKVLPSLALTLIALATLDER